MLTEALQQHFGTVPDVPTHLHLHNTSVFKCGDIESKDSVNDDYLDCVQE
jgi:hypothetical protein